VFSKPFATIFSRPAVRWLRSKQSFIPDVINTVMNHRAPQGLEILRAEWVLNCGSKLCCKAPKLMSSLLACHWDETFQPPTCQPLPYNCPCSVISITNSSSVTPNMAAERTGKKALGTAALGGCKRNDHRYCEDHSRNANTPCGGNAKFLATCTGITVGQLLQQSLLSNKQTYQNLDTRFLRFCS